MGKLNELRDNLMDNEAFQAGYEQRSRLVRFGYMLRQAREAQDLTQAQLAEKLGTGQSEISKLEKGEGVNGPTFDRMVSVAHALGLSLVVGFLDEQGDRTSQGQGAHRKIELMDETDRSSVVAAALNNDKLWSAF
ncbi:helix-turn-helix transcriptional regulator [Caballeronia sp. LZ033]|uniref:helix-turn-helix domain-containing protein n=1 Tax=Caballeronia sp. LZ033 TaxID=3038566 RepID=UPI002863A954|nr:helix-turn-helix transcriptional regulator [Caballeronia sp. LZ033]MDR5813297.1 helix-turn-helix transcriptional regulator [Caballeronia sp. LZ033]